MADLTLLSVFLVGLLGGLHCAGMCGGIVAVMGVGRQRTGEGGPAPAAAATGATARRTIPIAAFVRSPALPVLLGYNLGRILSYSIAGALAGAIGSTAVLMRNVLPVQQMAFVAVNLVLIAMGLYLTGVLRSVAALEVAGRGLWRVLGPRASRLLSADRFAPALAAGMVWGWVPCGMVYGVLIAALATGSALDGASLMLAVGLGTLPNLLALGWSANAARRWLAHRGLRVAAGLLVIGFGVAGLARVNPLAHLHRVVDFCVTLF